MESLLQAPPSPSRVLLAEESLPYRRVVREALESFRHCQVDDTPSGERAFEMALQRRYQLFIFSLPLPDISGILLDRMIARAFPLAHPGQLVAPPVIFILRPEHTQATQEIQRNARFRGTLFYPPKLDALLSLTSGLLPDLPRPAAAALIPPSHVSTD